MGEMINLYFMETKSKDIDLQSNTEASINDALLHEYFIPANLNLCTIMFKQFMHYKIDTTMQKYKLIMYVVN